MVIVELELELQKMLDGLRAAIVELESLSSKASAAEVAYKVGYAKAVLKSHEKTLREKEAEATVLTEDELLERVLSDRLVVAQREKCSAFRASIDALRSLMVNQRADSNF